MSWNDKRSIEQILKLKEKYNMNTFIETGTFNDDVMESVKRVNSSDRLKYRGILYCTPTSLDLSCFDLSKA